MTNYTSDVILGERYRDSQTDFEGVATAIFFYQYGCERVELQAFDKKAQDIRSLGFDAPRLVHIKTGKTPVVKRSGGPGSSTESRSMGMAR